MKVQAAMDTMPPEYAADCKMRVSPPVLGGKGPSVLFDLSRTTADLIEAHAKAHGVTFDELLRQVGVRCFLPRPKLYAAMKAAKMTASRDLS